MSEPSEREIEIFNAALDLPAAQRKSYLDLACAGDRALRRQIEEMLRANETAGDFLETEVAGTRSSGAAPRLPVVAPEKAGDRVGPYKLLQQIGEGGCGVVYMAEQEETVRRLVALKVIKLGMDTKQVIARFEAERQALALMDHTNIAKVLNAGATKAGRPFFVMELVRGIKITDYCDQNRLSTRERLELFTQVCRAIQHAHQKGIIHRDIKPSNILVTLSDGAPLPKVIDFGIAKATQGKLTDKTLFTAFEQFIGTPAYMSPEQAEMGAQDVDTRADIYGLGILLYELLTGETPFDPTKLLQGSLDEIRRIIREKVPVRPSTRLSAMSGAELAIKASARNVEAPRLIHLLRGDLDWIVMKALEKDRSRRYETANGMAMDVQRHLSNEPVLARPPSRIYQLHKLIQRNKLAFIAAAAIAFSLFMGLAASTTLLVRERQTHKQLQTEAERSRQVAQFLEDMLDGVGPAVAQGRDTTILKEILDKTAQRVGTDLTNQPVVRAELQNTVGNLYWAIGDYKKAEVMLRQSLATRRKVLGKDDPPMAESLHSLGEVLVQQRSLSEARTALGEALAISRIHFGSQSKEVAVCLFNLAEIASTPAEEEALLRDALGIDRKIFGDKNVQLARPLKVLGLVLAKEHKLQEAESVGREALEIELRSQGQGNYEVANSERFLAGTLNDENKLIEAEAMARASLELKLKTTGNEPAKLISVADSLNMLGSILYDADKLNESEKVAARAADIERKIEPYHPMLAWSLTTLGMVHGRMGYWKDAVKDFNEWVELEPDNTYAQFALAALLVDSDNLSGYRAQCQKIVVQFGEDTNRQNLNCAAQACLLIPRGGCDLETAARLADRCAIAAPQDPSDHVFGFVKGLAEYRRSHFADSIVWLGKVAHDGRIEADANSEVSAAAVIAMAESQLQHPTQARDALSQGSNIFETTFQRGAYQDYGADWVDWLRARILLREAQTLIDGPPSQGIGLSSGK